MIEQAKKASGLMGVPVEVHTWDEPTSNCCGSPRLWESDVCSKCKEHAVFEGNGEEE